MRASKPCFKLRIKWNLQFPSNPNFVKPFTKFDPVAETEKSKVKKTCHLNHQRPGDTGVGIPVHHCSLLTDHPLCSALH